MSVAFDAKGSATDSSGAVTSLTDHTLTIGGSANGLVYFLLTNANVTSPSLTWDSGGTNQAMTLSGSDFDSVSGTGIYLFTKTNPTTGLKTASASWTGSATVTLFGASWTGVSSFGNFNHNKGTSAGPSTVTITCAAADVAIAAHIEDSKTLTGTNATNLYLDTSALVFNAGNYSAGPTVALTGTLSGSSDWHSAGLAIQAAAAGATVVFRKTLSDIGGRVGSRQAWGG